ncbi:MAG: hypothetical protein ABF904_02060 [Ethanoligenens sp.]
MMGELLINDVRRQYDMVFHTLRKIVETFPESKWLEPHGDVYYIPCRIAYHLAVVIDNHVSGGFKDKDIASKLPYGKWIEATAESLPSKAEFLIYLDAVLDRAEKALAVLNDNVLTQPIEPERARVGATQIGLHLYMMRELSDHTGELNKMLIEDGQEDIWIAR